MKKICVICHREFECYDQPHKYSQGKNKRPFKAKTCSKVCASKFSFESTVEYNKNLQRINKSHTIQKTTDLKTS